MNRFCPTGKIRIVNLAEVGGKPLGPVDLYDMHPDSTSVPLIKNLAFGQVSDYVSPRGADPGAPSNLYLYQAGQKTGMNPFGTNIDNAGFAATDQMTIALGPSKLFNYTGIGYPAIVEAGSRNPHWIDTSRVVPAGKALLITLQANNNADSLPYFYLMIDGTCPKASNFPTGNSLTSVGTEVHFPVDSGAHTLGLVTAPSGLLNCNGKTPVSTSTSTATVAAGQRYIVFIYGLRSDGYKTLTSQIAGS
jgi:hypothetical protein